MEQVRESWARANSRKRYEEIKELAKCAVPILSSQRDEYESIWKKKKQPTIICIWGARVFAPDEDASRLSHLPAHQPIVFDSLQSIPIETVVVGESHGLLLSKSGVVYAFGTGRSGQLGLGQCIVYAQTPVPIHHFDNENVQSVACGSNHSVALTIKGEVFVWGESDVVGIAQHGVDSYLPQLLPQFAANKDSQNKGFGRIIAAGARHTMAVNGNNELYIWGEVFDCGFYLTPHQFFKFSVDDLVESIQIGNKFAIALTQNGNIYTWGDGTYCELGPLTCGHSYIASSGGRSTRQRFPARVTLNDYTGEPIPPIKKIAAGARHVLLLSVDGRVWSYGSNLAGQCGASMGISRIGMPRSVPITVNDSRVKVDAVAAGTRHSACLSDGRLFVWGHSSHHKLISTAASASLLLDTKLGERMGVAVQSGLKDCNSMPRLVHSLLHSKVTSIALGTEVTVVVTGCCGDWKDDNIESLIGIRQAEDTEETIS